MNAPEQHTRETLGAMFRAAGLDETNVQRMIDSCISAAHIEKTRDNNLEPVHDLAIKLAHGAITLIPRLRAKAAGVVASGKGNPVEAMVEEADSARSPTTGKTFADLRARGGGGDDPDLVLEKPGP